MDLIDFGMYGVRQNHNNYYYRNMCCIVAHSEGSSRYPRMGGRRSVEATSATPIPMATELEKKVTLPTHPVALNWFPRMVTA